MPAQMPLCPQMPRARGRGNTNAPIHARKCPYLSGGETLQVFDLPVRVSVLEPPIIPQNAPICTMPRYVRGKNKMPRAICPCMPLHTRVRTDPLSENSRPIPRQTVQDRSQKGGFFDVFTRIYIMYSHCRSHNLTQKLCKKFWYLKKWPYLCRRNE